MCCATTAAKGLLAVGQVSYLRCRSFINGPGVKAQAALLVCPAEIYGCPCIARKCVPCSRCRSSRPPTPLCPPRRVTWPNGEWGYSTRRHMQEPVRPEAVLPDRALSLPSSTLLDCFLLSFFCFQSPEFSRGSLDLSLHLLLSFAQYGLSCL